MSEPTPQTPAVRLPIWRDYCEWIADQPKQIPPPYFKRVPPLLWDAQQLANAIWPDRPPGTSLDEIIERANTQRVVWETAHLHEHFTE